MKSPFDSEVLTQGEVTFIGQKPGQEKLLPPGELVLSIVRGLGAGKQFTFATGQSVVIGRQADCHIELNHNLVSRQHTKIQWKLSEPWVADLNSTNGTFVNGKRVEEAILHDGDRLQVGNSLMKVSLHSESKSVGDYRDRVAQTVARSEQLVAQEPKRIFSGTLGEMNLPEILQAIASSRREGILVVRGPEVGKIYLRDGAIFSAKVGKVGGRKALFRILSWTDGTFDLRHMEDELIADLPTKALRQLTESISEDLMQILLEYFRVQDEFAEYANRAPALDVRLKQNPRKKFPPGSEYKRVAEIYDAVRDKPQVQDLLNAFTLLDSEIHRVLIFLLERKFLSKT